MIVRLGLPEGLTCAPQQSIRLSRRVAFHGLRESAGAYPGLHQHVHMIRHYHKSLEIVVLQLFRTVSDGSNDHLGDCFLLEVERPGAGCIQVSVAPDEGLPGALFFRWRVEFVRQAAKKGAT